MPPERPSSPPTPYRAGVPIVVGLLVAAGGLALSQLGPDDGEHHPAPCHAVTMKAAPFGVHAAAATMVRHRGCGRARA